MRSRVAKRSIVLAGHKTSVSLEDEFWKGLKEVAVLRLIICPILSARSMHSVNTAIFHRQFGFSYSTSIAAKCPTPIPARGLHEIIAHRPLMHA